MAVIENNNHKRTVSYAFEVTNNHIIKENRHIKSRNRMYFSDDLFEAINKDTKQSSTTSFGCHNPDLRSIATRRLDHSSLNTQHTSSFNLFQPCVAFHIEASHLFCRANKMTDFYMKCKTRQKWG